MQYSQIEKSISTIHIKTKRYEIFANRKEHLQHSNKDEKLCNICE